MINIYKLQSEKKIIEKKLLKNNYWKKIIEKKIIKKINTKGI